MSTCKDQLIKTINTDPFSAINISKITKIARWVNKTSCIDELGGFGSVKDLIDKEITTRNLDINIHTSANTEVRNNNINNTTSYGAAIDSNTWKPVAYKATWSDFERFMWRNTTQSSDKSSTWIVWSTQIPFKNIPLDKNIYSGIWLLDYVYIGLLFVGFGIFLWYFFRFVRFVFSILYDLINADRIVYMNVILPRWDSKNDREVSREISKDAKEKIGRMSQVFRSLHKLGQLSASDNFLNFLFKKAKVTVIYHYDKWTLSFMVATYPEYQEIVEGAIAAQYPESSIETTIRPKFFGKKYRDIVPLEPSKDPIYPIKTFKQIEDDPINNVIDTIAQFSNEDTLDIILTIKPEWDDFNKRAQKRAEWLYRNDSRYTSPDARYVSVFHFLGNIFSGPSKDPAAVWPTAGGKDMVRMTKSKEEALNVMWEEAWRHAFDSSLIIVSSSDTPDNPKTNIRNLIGTYNVYKDEFNNELDVNEWKMDAFGRLLKPLWKSAVGAHLVRLFFRKNIFTENALTSLFHFPDGIYNRSPIIKWMDYKVLAAPDNLAVLTQANDGFVVSGSITEWYLGGKVPLLFEDSHHRAVGQTIDNVEKIVPFDPILHKDIPEAEIIINLDGTKSVTITEQKKRFGLKTFKDGSLIGVNVYRNKFTPVYIKRKDRSRHHYVIGKSGWGKSVLLGFLARQDARNGDGFCVIDPHGDLVEDIMNYIPKDRMKDVIYFDAGNEDRPIGLNLYDIDNLNEADRVVNDATEMFLKMFGPEVFGPRLQEYFKFGSLTLLEDREEGAMLLDIPRLYTDEAFREYKVAKVTNPVVKNFRERTYASMGDREKEEIIPYLTAKFVSFTTNSLIRNIIWQTKSVINFRKCMDEGKILLVNLSKGKIGELNAQLLGMIFVSQINNGAMSRADIPEDQRRDFFLYVDEFQNFVTNTFADILSEARKYHLALIMAHQYIAQLDWWWSNNIWESSGGKKSVKDAVFGNVGTIQSFKIGAPDAEFMEKEYAPVLSGQDIIGISNFKTYLKLNISNATTRVFSLDTIWTEDYKNPKIAEVIKKYSEMKYGRDRKFVEAELAARIWIVTEEPIEETPVVEENLAVDQASNTEIPSETEAPVNDSEIQDLDSDNTDEIIEESPESTNEIAEESQDTQTEENSETEQETQSEQYISEDNIDQWDSLTWEETEQVWEEINQTSEKIVESEEEMIPEQNKTEDKPKVWPMFDISNKK